MVLHTLAELRHKPPCTLCEFVCRLGVSSRAAEGDEGHCVAAFRDRAAGLRRTLRQLCPDQRRFSVGFQPWPQHYKG